MAGRFSCSYSYSKNFKADYEYDYEYEYESNITFFKNADAAAKIAFQILSAF